MTIMRRFTVIAAPPFIQKYTLIFKLAPKPNFVYLSASYSHFHTIMCLLGLTGDIPSDRGETRFRLTTALND